MNWKLILALAAPAAIILTKLYGRHLGRKAARSSTTHSIFDRAADKGKR